MHETIEQGREAIRNRRRHGAHAPGEVDIAIHVGTPSWVVVNERDAFAALAALHEDNPGVALSLLAHGVHWWFEGAAGLGNPRPDFDKLAERPMFGGHRPKA